MQKVQTRTTHPRLPDEPEVQTRTLTEYDFYNEGTLVDGRDRSKQQMQKRLDDGWEVEDRVTSATGRLYVFYTKRVPDDG